MSRFSDRLAAQWQDAVNFVLGAWLVLSPWVLAYTAQAAATWNAYILGVIIAVASAAAFVRYHKWEDWLTAVLGAWLVISPWVLGFSALAAAMWNAVIVGAAVLALAIWSAVSDHEPERLATKS